MPAQHGRDEILKMDEHFSVGRKVEPRLKYLTRIDLEANFQVVRIVVEPASTQ